MTNIRENKKQSHFPGRAMKALSLAVSMSAIVLTGCGGGSGSGWESNGDSHTSSVSASAVKGPIANGEARLYILDYAATDLKGSLVATGSTDDKGEIQGLGFGDDLIAQGPFLIEVSGGQERNGTTPVIPTLRSIVTAAQAEAGRILYATPLTTFTLAMAQAKADLSDASTAKDNFAAQLLPSTGDEPTAIELVKSNFGINLLGNVNIFQDSPTLTESTIEFDESMPEDTPAQVKAKEEARKEAADSLTQAQSSADYRTASEAFAVLVAELSSLAPGQNTDAILEGLAKDAADGTLDGMQGSQPVIELVELTAQQVVYTMSKPVEQVLARNIPGYDTPISQVRSFIENEASEIAPEVKLVVAIPEPSQPPADNVAGADSDGDGVPDSVDQFPDDATKAGDSDGDTFDDVVDVFPIDGNEWEDNDGDLVGDNLADKCPTQSNGFNNSDTDEFCDCSKDITLAENEAFCAGADAFPNDSLEWADANKNGIGDNSEGAPRANAGLDQTGDSAVQYTTSGVVVKLDGSATVDPDGSGVTYEWSFADCPGEGACIPTIVADTDNPNDPSKAQFTVLMMSNDEIGDYIVNLKATNSEGFSEDRVTVAVEKPWLSASTLFGSAIIGYALFLIPARRARKRK